MPDGFAAVNIRAEKQNVAPGTGQCSHCSLYDSEERMHDKGCIKIFLSFVIDGYWWRFGLWDNLEYFDRSVSKR